MACSPHSKKRVCYYYDSDIGNYYYGQGHPMKPHRIRLTHNLMINYGLFRKMEIYRPHRSTAEDMSQFHTDDYIHFLRTIKPSNKTEHQRQMQLFNVGDDCPVFDGLYEFCQLSAGGSIAGAIKLNKGTSDIAINWAGGLHHAKKSEASGFCYINDIVLAILELLKYHARVLYVDIDIHHGDGVEEAFYLTDRVMTVSFHKYGEYFPGTGDLRDIGASKGKYYSINFPLRDGIDDQSYESIFVPIMTKVMETYRPSAVVMQCGADSLAGDRLGCFNLSVKGHGNCVEFMMKQNVPLLLLGGGGYTIRNVSRCWTYETAVALGVASELANQLPYNDFFEYYGPDFKLHVSPTNMPNQNSTDYLQAVMERVFENLRMIPFAPGVQMLPIPDDGIVEKEEDSSSEEEDSDQENSDVRMKLWEEDRRVAIANEFSDSEDEGDGRKDERSPPRKRHKADDSGKNSALTGGGHDFLAEIGATLAASYQGRTVSSSSASEYTVSIPTLEGSTVVNPAPSTEELECNADKKSQGQPEGDQSGGGVEVEENSEAETTIEPLVDAKEESVSKGDNDHDDSIYADFFPMHPPPPPPPPPASGDDYLSITITPE